VSDWTTFTDPSLVRILTTTTATPDLGASERCYAEWLGFRTIERGWVDPSLARSWGAPAAAGTRFCTMVPQGDPDVFVRLVETPGIPGYRPLTTFGWNAFEIIVDDVHKLAEEIAHAPFEVIGAPRPLQFMPSIIAMQVVGPAGECLYFTMESGDRETSILPPPGGFVGRTFIVVAAGPDFPTMLRWYVDQFQLRERPVRQSKVQVIQQAQGLDPDETVFLSAIGMQQRGNLIELDGYPTGPGRIAGPRPRAPGHLPPGNAMVSFEVADLTPFVAMAITPPQPRSEAAYRGRRACTLLGPAGELVELVETL
jgi:catechol 2,3-dioxygenase-like lactoylglutathione lyase family enzyme